MGQNISESNDFRPRNFSMPAFDILREVPGRIRNRFEEPFDGQFLDRIFDGGCRATSSIPIMDSRISILSGTKT
jgi:hypothetical protein